MKKHLSRFLIGLITISFFSGIAYALYKTYKAYEIEISNFLNKFSYISNPEPNTNYIIDFIVLLVGIYMSGYLIVKYRSGELKEWFKVTN